MAELPPPVEDPTVPVPRTREYPWMSVARWQAMQRAEAAAAARGGIEVLFLGDSLVEGWTTTGLAAWAHYFVPLRAANFGIGGDTTQNVLWRLDEPAVAALNPRVVVLLIGTNNLGNHLDRPDAVARGLAAVVRKLRFVFPAAKVLVLGILPADAAPDSPRRRDICTVNATLPALADDPHVVTADIGAVFLEPDGTIAERVMPDYLHLSAEGYHRWAEAVAPRVRAWLGRGP